MFHVRTRNVAVVPVHSFTFLQYIPLFRQPQRRYIIMAARQLQLLVAGHSVLLLMFRSSFFFFFSPPNLPGRLADRHQTLPYGCWWPTSMEFWKKFERSLSPEIWRPKSIKLSARFRTTSRLDRECRRNATWHRQSENGVANYGHSRTGKLTVYFGPQTAKNGTVVLTHPTGGHHAVLCHAFLVSFGCDTTTLTDWCMVVAC